MNVTLIIIIFLVVLTFLISLNLYRNYKKTRENYRSSSRTFIDSPTKSTQVKEETKKETAPIKSPKLLGENEDGFFEIFIKKCEGVWEGDFTPFTLDNLSDELESQIRDKISEIPPLPASIRLLTSLASNSSLQMSSLI